jgi:hypothetical protein
MQPTCPVARLLAPTDSELRHLSLTGLLASTYLGEDYFDLVDVDSFCLPPCHMSRACTAGICTCFLDLDRLLASTYLAGAYSELV